MEGGKRKKDKKRWGGGKKLKAFPVSWKGIFVFIDLEKSKWFDDKQRHEAF